MTHHKIVIGDSGRMTNVPDQSREDIRSHLADADKLEIAHPAGG